MTVIIIQDSGQAFFVSCQGWRISFCNNSYLGARFASHHLDLTTACYSWYSCLIIMGNSSQHQIVLATAYNLTISIHCINTCQYWHLLEEDMLQNSRQKAYMADSSAFGKCTGSLGTKNLPIQGSIDDLYDWCPQCHPSTHP